MNSQHLKSANHCVFRLQYHLVLVTKYRRKAINAAMIERFSQIFYELAEKWGCSIVEFNGEADHIHLLLDANPQVQLSKLVNNFKTVSSRLIRRDFKSHLTKYYWKPVFWSRSYFIISVGGAPISVLRQYIENQDAPVE